MRHLASCALCVGLAPAPRLAAILLLRQTRQRLPRVSQLLTSTQRVLSDQIMTSFRQVLTLNVAQRLKLEGTPTDVGIVCNRSIEVHIYTSKSHSIAMGTSST
jgi:hypothetical protein